MSYCLIKNKEKFTIIDITSIFEGAPSRGMQVAYKSKKVSGSGTFINFGTLPEMKKLMNEMESKKKRRGRPKKELTTGFSVYPPNDDGMDEDVEGMEEDGQMGYGEEREEQEGDAMQMDLRSKRTRPPRSPTPQLLSGDTTPGLTRSSPGPSAPTVSSTAIDADLLRSLLIEQIAPLQSTVQQLKRSLNRLEEASADDTNSMESITAKAGNYFISKRLHLKMLVKLIEERDRNVTNNLEKVSATLERVVSALPSTTSVFDYKFIRKEVVDLYDENENLLIFATRLDEILFPTERHLRLEMRDPVKVKWLMDLLSYRRKMSIGPDRTQRLKQVKNRLNGNVSNYLKKQKNVTPRPPRDIPRSDNGRFIPLVANTSVQSNYSQHSPDPSNVPVYANGQWMLPISAPFNQNNPPMSTYHYPTYHSPYNYNRSVSPSVSVRRPPSLPPRMSSLPPKQEDFMDDYNMYNNDD